VKKALSVLALTTGVILSGAALAKAGKFDGTWSVKMVAEGASAERDHSDPSGAKRQVRAGASGVSVSGQAGPSGWVSLDLQRASIQGTAAGKLSSSSGAGTWTMLSLGCSGRWTAQRQTITAQVN
jgi:hypothetical protein